MTDVRGKLAELIYNNSPRLVEEESEILANRLIANGVTVLPKTGIGDMSDGYHTFNELYHHRAVLFSVICNLHPLCSWKAKKHHDGTMYDGMFIVGINTPEGQATYHYDIDPYWDMFKVPEADFAPEWDGHTADEAIRRIALLGTDGTDSNVPTKWISVKDRLPYPFVSVLVQMPGEKPFLTVREGFISNDGIWQSAMFRREPGEVTHWQPMPEPPEGRMIMALDSGYFEVSRPVMTNADRIRAMSDDKLAEFIRRMVDGSNTHEVACYGCIHYGTHHSDPENKGTDLYGCDGCRSEGIGLDVLKWLRLPVREAHKGEGGGDGEGG